MAGTEVLNRDIPTLRSIPTDTGTAFVTGLTEKGREGPVFCRSFSRFVREFGGRVSWSALYDALDLAFREGLSGVYVSRVLGPAAAAATLNLSDGTGTTLVVNARDKGLEGNSLNVQVAAGAAGGTFALVVTHDAVGELERSPDLPDTAAAVAWAESSDHVRAVEGPSPGDPSVIAATSLAGGADDRTSVTAAHRKVALDRFFRALGPGQVAAPGVTDATSKADLVAHAAANNRYAYLDAPDTTSKAALLADAAALRTVADARYGALFAPWPTIPGLVPGTTRTVPSSGLALGLTARSDARNDAGEAPAGQNGRSVYVRGLRLDSTTLTDLDYEDLEAGSVNMVRVDKPAPGDVSLYGVRTLVSKAAEPNFFQFPQMRLMMDVTAEVQAILERYVFAQVDGRRRKLAAIQNHISGHLLTAFYLEDALFGETPEEAFAVDCVSDDANPVDRLADGELRALVGLKVSPTAERIVLEISKYQITDTIAVAA